LERADLTFYMLKTFIKNKKGYAGQRISLVRLCINKGGMGESFMIKQKGYLFVLNLQLYNNKFVSNFQVFSLLLFIYSQKVQFISLIMQVSLQTKNATYGDIEILLLP
jgi:hypothetical protein